MALCQAAGSIMGILVGMNESNTRLDCELERDIKHMLQDKCGECEAMLARMCATIYINVGAWDV